jgi:hypothetical protein
MKDIVSPLWGSFAEPGYVLFHTLDEHVLTSISRVSPLKSMISSLRSANSESVFHIIYHYRRKDKINFRLVQVIQFDVF